MKLKRFNTLNEKSILDTLRDEQEQKDINRRSKEEEIDSEQRKQIAAHANSANVEPVGIDKMPDFNLIKIDILDKIGEILFYSLKEGREDIKEQLENIINQNSEFLKSTKIDDANVIKKFNSTFN